MSVVFLNEALAWELLLVALLSGIVSWGLRKRARWKGTLVWATGLTALGLGTLLVLLTLAGEPNQIALERELGINVEVDLRLFLDFVAAALGLSTVLGRAGGSRRSDGESFNPQYTGSTASSRVPDPDPPEPGEVRFHECSQCAWKVAVGTPGWRQMLNTHVEEAHKSGARPPPKPKDSGRPGVGPVPTCPTCGGRTVLVPTNNQFYCSRCGRYT